MSSLTVPIGPDDHVLGSAQARVTLVEYGDYQCPFCARAFVVVRQLVRRLGPALRFAFRHFPLTQIHERALPAALAAEAAAAQGAFWPMHDALFENQQALEDRDLIDYAAGIGLDAGRFRRDLETDAHIAKIEHDFATGVRSGVHATPTFFIDNERYDGGVELSSLARALRRAVAPSMRP